MALGASRLTGLARYQAAAGGATDEYWDDVGLLLLGGGSNGSTSIVDSSSNSLSITNNGSVTYSTTQTKFASTSMYFSGSNYLVVPNNTVIQMPGDFTWEAWVYPTTTSGFFCMIATSSSYGRIMFANNAGLYWESDDGSSGNGVSVSSGYPPTGSWTINTWQHVALTRSGSSWRFFKDGSQVGSTKTASFTPETSRNIEVGSFNGGGSKFTGYMEGIRYTKGVARYTSGFTAPTEIFPTS